MDHHRLLRRIVLLVPIGLTFVPLPEMSLSLYFAVPRVSVGILVFILACAISTLQMFYQYWAAGEMGSMAPGTMSAVGRWLDQQVPWQMLMRETSIALAVLGLLPGLRTVGIGVWRKTGHPYGACYLMVGTAAQIAIVFGLMLGAGRVLRELFS